MAYGNSVGRLLSCDFMIYELNKNVSNCMFSSLLFVWLPVVFGSVYVCQEISLHEVCLPSISNHGYFKVQCTFTTETNFSRPNFC